MKYIFPIKLLKKNYRSIVRVKKDLDVADKVIKEIDVRTKQVLIERLLTG